MKIKIKSKEDFMETDEKASKYNKPKIWTKNSKNSEFAVL